MAAQGVKIMAKDLEKALAGLPLYVAKDQDEIDYYKVKLFLYFLSLLLQLLTDYTLFCLNVASFYSLLLSNYIYIYIYIL